MTNHTEEVCFDYSRESNADALNIAGSWEGNLKENTRSPLCVSRCDVSKSERVIGLRKDRISSTRPMQA